MTAPVRQLRFRYHPERPPEVSAQRAWVVELLLDRAYDCNDPALVDALCALNPHCDETIAAEVGRLYDAADAAADAEAGATVRYYNAVDVYVEQLRVVAGLVASVRSVAA